MQLRPYQDELWKQTEHAYSNGHKYVMDVLPTGGGKTWLLARAAAEDFPTCTIAHRQELIGQITTTFGQAGIPHNIIAPQSVINACIERQIKKVGRSFYNPNAIAHVAGVDTLIRRHKKGDRFCKSIKRWSIDECHHTLGVNLDYDDANKWGKACQMFENAQGFGVTATPLRADGRSLHIDQGGAFDFLAQGVDMTDLIEMGNLVPYRVVAPEPSIAEAELKIGSTGEFTQSSKDAAFEKSHITGDVVETWLKFANGMKTIIFAVNVKHSYELADAFRNVGVKTTALDGMSADTERNKAVDSFENGDTAILINTALFDEGFDVPGAMCVIQAAPTNSYGRFAQQIGRVLRPAPDKEFGLVIDHCGNVLRHAAKNGMPDTPRKWQLWLEEGTKRGTKDPDAIPHRSCEVCTLTFPSLSMVCPFCGHEHLPADRGQPEQVAGILSEMSSELLMKLRMAKAEITDPRGPKIPAGASDAIVGAQNKRFVQRQMAHAQLHKSMEFFGGVFHAQGWTDEQMQAKFFHTFGVDVLSAQGLKTKEALVLDEKIQKYLLSRHSI